MLDSENRLTTAELDTGYRCRYVTGTITNPISYTFDVYMNGKHQPRNAAAAVKAVQILETMGFAVTPEAIREGIKNTHVPARIEIIESQVQTSPHVKMTVILDSSHNVESIKGLCDFLEQKKKRRLTLIFGVLADKDYKQMVKLLLPFIEKVIITEPISRRALPAEKLAGLFNKWGVNDVLVQQDFKQALATAQKWQAEILVTGSFYLVGEIRHIMMHGGR